MSERSPAPGGLGLVETLVNTLDLETGADSLDTEEGRAPLGLTEDDVPAARELRESLRATLLAHAGHPPHRAVTPLGSCWRPPRWSSPSTRPTAPPPSPRPGRAP